MSFEAARRFALALAISSAVTVLWALPVVTHMNSRLLGGPSDATSTIRDYWYDAHIGKSPFSATHDAFVTAPEGIDLSPGIQAANGVQPLFVWTLKGAIGLVAAWNVFVLLGVALTAACTWFLLDWLGVGRVGSVFGAYAFGFSGYIVQKAFVGHAGLVQAWVFPLLLLALLDGRRRHWWRGPLVSGLIAAFSFYLHTYYGFFALFVIILFYSYETVFVRRPGLQAARLGLGLATTAAGLIPAFVALHALGVAPGGGSHSVDALQRFGARVEAYVAPSQWSPLGHLLTSGLRARLESSGEPSLFFGFSTLILATLYVLLQKHDAHRSVDDRFVTGFSATLVVCGFVMSLPREFAVGPLHVPAPSWFIGHFSTTVRVYARFGVLLGLGLTILAAFAIRGVERTKGTRWAVACVAILALELTPTLPAQTWKANKPPPADRWLAAHPGGIVAIYPLVSDQLKTKELNNEEYYFQRFHGHPLYSAIVPSIPPFALALRGVSQYFTNPDTPHILAAEHVRYVVIRDDVYRSLGEEPPVLSSPDFKLVAHVRDARIYSVTATALDLAIYAAQHSAELAAAEGQQPPVDKFGSGFYGPETFKYATPWRWAGQNAQIAITPRAGVSRVRFKTLAFSNAIPRTLKLYGPDHTLLGEAKVPTSMTPITIGPFPVLSGVKNTFTLVTSPDPAPLGDSDPRVASIYVNQPVFQPLLDTHP